MRLSKATGFTLIELLVVILIIGVLVAVSAPSFLGQTQKAQDSAAQQYLAVAYRAAKAGATDRDGSFGSASQVVSDVQASEPELDVVAGSCPTDTSGDPKHVVVDSAYTGAAHSDDLLICNDPTHTVWYLKVDHGGPVQIYSTEQQDTSSGGSTGSGAYSYSNVQVLTSNLNENNIRLRADGHLLAQAAPGGGDYEYDDVDPSGGFSQLPGTPAGNAPPDYVPAPTGSDWAYVDGGSATLYVVDAAGAATPVATGAAGAAFEDLDWKGGLIAYFSSDRKTVMATTPGGSSYVVYTSPVGALLSDVSLSADGSKVAFCGSGTVYVYSTSGSGTPLAIANANCAAFVQLALSPDGSKVAWLGRNIPNTIHGLFVSSTASDTSTLIDAAAGPNMGVAWSPDSTHLAYVSEDASENLTVQAINADGSDQQSVAPAQLDSWFPLWSADGSKIYFSNDWQTDGVVNDYGVGEIFSVDVSH